MTRRLEVGGWNYLTSHGMEEVRVLRGEEKSLFSFEKSLFGARSERVLRGEEIGEGVVGVDGVGAAAGEGSGVGGGGVDKIRMSMSMSVRVSGGQQTRVQCERRRWEDAFWFFFFFELRRFFIKTRSNFNYI